MSITTIEELPGERLFEIDRSNSLYEMQKALENPALPRSWRSHFIDRVIELAADPSYARQTLREIDMSWWTRFRVWWITRPEAQSVRTY